MTRTRWRQIGARIGARRLVLRSLRRAAADRRDAARSARLITPNRVNTAPWRPLRVGSTQSNMSMPRADRLDQILRHADAHQIARLVGREQRRGVLDHLEHDVLAARRPQARRSHSRGSRCRSAPSRSRRATLHRRRPARCRTAHGPAARSRMRACSAPPRRATAALRARSRRRGAGSLMHSSSCMEMSAPSSDWISMARSGVSSTIVAVDVRAKGDAVVGDLAQLRQRHDLEAAGVGQDRPRPVHELVQPAERGDALRAGPQHQVIGVGEHDVGAGAAHLVEGDALHGRLRADRHEGRRRDRAARRRYLAAARGAVGGEQLEGEGVGYHFSTSFRGAAISAFTRVFDALWRRTRNPSFSTGIMDSGFAPAARPGMTPT